MYVKRIRSQNRPDSFERFSMLFILRRTGIISVAIGILNLTIHAMRNEF